MEKPPYYDDFTGGAGRWLFGPWVLVLASPLAFHYVSGEVFFGPLRDVLDRVPGVDPRWLSVYRDHCVALAYMLAYAVLLFLAALVWRRHRFMAVNIIGFSWFVLSAGSWEGVVTWVRCSDVLSPLRFQSPWPDYIAQLDDPLFGLPVIAAVNAAGLLLYVALLSPASRKVRAYKKWLETVWKRLHKRLSIRCTEAQRIIASLTGVSRS